VYTQLMKTGVATDQQPERGREMEYKLEFM
jgi:hypothetical protein